MAGLRDQELGYRRAASPDNTLELDEECIVASRELCHRVCSHRNGVMVLCNPALLQRAAGNTNQVYIYDTNGTLCIQLTLQPRPAYVVLNTIFCAKLIQVPIVLCKFVLEEARVEAMRRAGIDIDEI